MPWPALLQLLVAPLAHPHAPAAPPQESPSGLILSSAEESGFAPVEVLLPGDARRLVLPFTSRSERVVRAVTSPSGSEVALRLESAGAPLSARWLGAWAVRHPAANELLLIEGAPWSVGPPSLPHRVRRASDGEHGSSLVPELARIDAVGVRGELVVELTEGQLARAVPLDLVLVATESADPTARATVRVSAGGEEPAAELGLEPGPRRAARIALSDPTRELRLSVEGELALDRLAFARCAPLGADAERLPLTVRSASRATVGARRLLRRHGLGPRWLVGAEAEPPAPAEPLASIGEPETAFPVEPGTRIDLALAAPPPAGEGEAWTLVLELAVEAEDGPSGEPRGVPVAAAAPPPERAALFADVAARLGAAVSHLEGPDEQLDIRPTMGPGAAWGDVDGDGWVDLYVVQGGGRAESEAGPNRLFRNERDSFRDVTSASGAGDRGAGMGALFFDAEGDGDLDLYVANYGPDALLRNDGSGRFADVSAAAGLAGARWSAGIAAADADLDGDLDLYVTSYLHYDEGLMPPASELGSYRREDPVAMLPFAFPGERNAFLRNDSAPRDGEAPLLFTDVTEELGLSDELGRGMQPVFWDFDADGDPDLYVANDVSPNVLWRNEGDGTFRDVSFGTGMDDPRGCMGLAVGDVEADGDEDLFVTNWQLESNALYLSNRIVHGQPRRHAATFRDGIVASGLGPSGIGLTSWGVELLDLENDGDLDLFVANGYTSPDYVSTGICVGQPCQVFRNDGAGRFRDASAEAGEAVLEERAGRTAIACDFDQDGGLDVLVTANNGPLRLLCNAAPGRGHWLGVRLRSGSANPFGIGAAVQVVAGERTWLRSLRAGTSYLGGNAPELHFGLGAVTSVDVVRVRWPSGRTSEHAVPRVDRFVTLDEPDAGPR